jgi:hypothetical protein
MSKKLELTEEEEELITAIRNLRNSKHNYSYQLEDYVRQLFDRIIDEIKD